MIKKKAVVLFNLGGPDRLESVKPFLFNLFNDKAIISLPRVFRFMLAYLISSKREKTAKEIYSFIGGSSPILKNTKDQAKKITGFLMNEKESFSVHVCMRYWHPMAKEVVKKVINTKPDEILLVPLYPQYSTTTTGSSFLAWDKEFKKYNKNIVTKRICCYPSQDYFIAAHVEKLKKIFDRIMKKEKTLRNTTVLFSAHGLPKKIIKGGDPYQYQIELTVKQILSKTTEVGFNFSICYQSKVGPLKWLEPSTEQAVINAAKNKRTIVIIPIAFVSEHSETLVELDIEYSKLAKDHGCKNYYRISALGISNAYIKSLVSLILGASNRKGLINRKICPNSLDRCYQKGMD